MLRLNTVRAKLTALVAFSAALTLVSIAVLSWLMHRQLIDEVDDRVPEAIRGFNLELEDDLSDVQATVESLALRRQVAEAMRARDAKTAAAAGKPFENAYPDLDIAFFDVTGKVFAHSGLATPPETVASVLGGLVPGSDGAIRGFVPRGCEHPSSVALPGYVLARAVPDAGTILACIPIDVRFLDNASQKLGTELALLGPDGGLLEASQRFPRSLAGKAGSGPTIEQEDEKTWALDRLDPERLGSSVGAYRVVLALDVTDIKNVVRRHLMLATFVLLFAASASIAMGGRLATVMSRALGRLNAAQKKLEQQQYVHVDALKTGDELEDLATGFNAMVDGLKERDKLRTTFGKYMTQAVLEHLLAGRVELGGETLPVTVLFSDIRSFTTISEKMNAHELVALLNEYFTEMVGAIMGQDGVVDKYIGDAIMAVFGAPVPKPDDAVRAVRAAVKMREALATLNQRLVARGVPPIQTGIGIHTGDVVAGNIGSEERMEYTVIGDAVNLASRLESNTKELGVPILISEDTFRLVCEHFETRPVREITVKGRVQPVTTYEVLGERTRPWPASS
jgi:adenylate cyclase